MKYSKVNRSIDAILNWKYLKKLNASIDKWIHLADKWALQAMDEDWRNLMIFAETGRPVWEINPKYV